jgi:tripartite-type tricarboxylate transporter receptor subunit TctC
MRARKVLAWAALALTGLSAPAGAEGYPDRSVRMIVAFPAGGTLDVLARIVSTANDARQGRSAANPGGSFSAVRS